MRHRVIVREKKCKFTNTMKVLYITKSYLTDSDFPLIREYQKRNIDVDTYIFGGNSSAGILNIKKSKFRYGLYNASKYNTISCLYKDYIDLNKVHFISLIGGKKGILFRYVILLYLLIKFSFKKYDVAHYTWPLEGKEEQLLYKINTKKILTVHDSKPHSGQEKQEYDRIVAFKKCDYFVLLSQSLVDEFSTSYEIPRSKISVAGLGDFNYLDFIQPTERPLSNKYILFFGRIFPHKGVEYLLEAMVEVHKVIPDLKLIIAGKGDYYFDYNKFKDLDYIVFMPKLVDMQEMVNLFKGSEFCVCPYKDATQSGVIQTSFSMSVPVLATSVGALPSCIDDGINGILVPPCNTKALSASIIKMLNTPDLLNTMRENINVTWRKKMSWKPIVDHYLNVYNEIF